MAADHHETDACGPVVIRMPVVRRYRFTFHLPSPSFPTPRNISQHISLSEKYIIVNGSMGALPKLRQGTDMATILPLASTIIPSASAPPCYTRPLEPFCCPIMIVFGWERTPS